MPRNITLTFAALSLPGKVNKATEEPPETANLCVGQPGHDKHAAQPLTKPSMCTTCGEITDREVLLKAIKTGTSSYAVIDKDELVKADVAYRHQYKAVIELVPHRADEFLAATAPGGQVNYITPAGIHGTNQYRVLVELIESHPELVFVGLHTPSSVTALFQVRAHKGVLIMEERVRQDNMRAVPEIVGGEVNATLLKMLDTFLPELVVPYTAEAYEDSYGRALSAMQEMAEVVASASGEVAAPASSDNQVIELLAKQMEKLTEQAKVKATQQAKAKDPAKKTAAARKTAAKKTTTRKVSA